MSNRSINTSYSEDKDAKSYSRKVLVKINNRSKYKRIHKINDFFNSGRYHLDYNEAFWINPGCHHYFWARKKSNASAGISGAVSYKVEYIGETKQKGYHKYIVFGFSNPNKKNDAKCEAFPDSHKLKDDWDNMKGKYNKYNFPPTKYPGKWCGNNLVDAGKNQGYETRFYIKDSDEEIRSEKELQNKRQKERERQKEIQRQKEIARQKEIQREKEIQRQK
eukprot:201709_1